MKCTYCGKENAVSAKFCIECGRKLNALNRCPSCGTIIAGGKFCPECGARLNSEANQPAKSNKGAPAANAACPANAIGSANADDLLGDLYDDPGAGIAAAKREESKRYSDRKKRLKDARAYINGGNYAAAKSIYDKLIEDDRFDMDAYMGLIRVATKNYSEYEGEEIDKSIRVARRICGTEDLGKYDEEYEGYIDCRNQYFDEKAAEEEEPDPFIWFLLGVGYTMGTDEQPVDNEKAAFYYRKAAELGNQQAQCALGACYEEGCGVEQDLNEAIKWYKIAAANGSNTAKDKLKKLGY